MFHDKLFLIRQGQSMYWPGMILTVSHSFYSTKEVFFYSFENVWIRILLHSLHRQWKYIFPALYYILIILYYNYVA